MASSGEAYLVIVYVLVQQENTRKSDLNSLSAFIQNLFISLDLCEIMPVKDSDSVLLKELSRNSKRRSVLSEVIQNAQHFP